MMDLLPNAAVPDRVAQPPIRSHRVERHQTHAIAIAVPMSGKIGIWGPSSISAAQLAIAQINAGNGVGDRPLEALFLNSDEERLDCLCDEIDALLSTGSIAGLVSSTFSEARSRINAVIRGRIPHIFTPPYHGMHYICGEYTIGGTPGEQILPSLLFMSSVLKVRRWALVGKNYVWPHPSGIIARHAIKKIGGTIVYENFVRNTVEEPYSLVEEILRAKPDIVWVSLAGTDAIAFNRVFCDANLQKRIFRFSTTIDETSLLGFGENGTDRLFTAGTYFSALETDSNLRFMEAYHAMHGVHAPAMNLFGQAIYEGVHFYQALRDRACSVFQPIRYNSARGGMFHSNWDKKDPVYLAEADGFRLQVTKLLNPGGKMAR